MAISKIKPIKKTLKKAIDYITNASKTDQKRLISSFGCSPATADIEMQMTSDRANKSSGRIAYHLMQSFSLDDKISPEKAHEMGKEFAERLLQGKYEYVLATHIDKGHYHNHIIFNATSFADLKKYHMPCWHKYKMFQVNDQICKENNISVIENRSNQKGKGWYENEVLKEGKSWKEKLKISMDDAISKAATYDEFLQIMKTKGYVYKETDKVLKFKGGEEQERYTRVNEHNFGEFYTKDILLKRINDKEFNKGLGNFPYKRHGKISKESKSNRKSKNNFLNNKGVSLIIDIEKNLKAQQSKGYEHALVMANINTMAKTINFLQKNSIISLDQLVNKQEDLKFEIDKLSKMMSDIKSKKTMLIEKIKYCKTYEDYRIIAEQALNVPKGDNFIEKHKESLLLFGIATEYMQKNQIAYSRESVTKMNLEYYEIKEQELLIQSEIKKLKDSVQEYNHILDNVKKILNRDSIPESKTKEKEYDSEK